MLIKVVNAFYHEGHRAVGSVLELPDSFAKSLIRSGQAKAVAQADPAPAVKVAKKAK